MYNALAICTYVRHANKAIWIWIWERERERERETREDEGEKVSLIPADDSLIAGNICLYSQRIIYMSKENLLSANTQCSLLWHSTQKPRAARRERHFSDAWQTLESMSLFLTGDIKLVYHGNVIQLHSLCRNITLLWLYKNPSTKRTNPTKTAPGGNLNSAERRLWGRVEEVWNSQMFNRCLYAADGPSDVSSRPRGERGCDQSRRAEKCPHNNTHGCRWGNVAP